MLIIFLFKIDFPRDAAHCRRAGRKEGISGQRVRLVAKQGIAKIFARQLIPAVVIGTEWKEKCGPFRNRSRLKGCVQAVGGQRHITDICFQIIRILRIKQAANFHENRLRGLVA